mmetsp:Transcript_1553/g.2327  ORF Transcript_1553/g.2327 Transcript_1553/m.2327 type:complete len:493 (-) Transcript_1553:239-1717(-)
MDESEELEYTRRVDFDGVWYEVTTTLGKEGQAELMVEVEAETSGERWVGSFSSSYIETLTSKTGNFKRASTFARMVVSAVEGSAESVYVDLLTSADLEALRRRRHSAQPVVVNGGVISSKPPISNRRYLIVTYAVEFDKVHYPLPLDIENEPSAMSLRRQLRRAKKKIATMIEDQRNPDNSPIAALKTQLNAMRRQRETDRAEIISLRRRLALLSSSQRRRKPSPAVHNSKAPPSVTSSRSTSTINRGRSPGRGSPGSRFDPTAYARARAERLAAAKNRRSAWGSPSRGYSSDCGYSSAGGYSSGDSRRSVASYASSHSRNSNTSQRSTQHKSTTKKNKRTSSPSSNNTGSRSKQSSPLTYFCESSRLHHLPTRATTTTTKTHRESSPSRRPSPGRSRPSPLRDSVQNNNGYHQSLRWRYDTKENSLPVPTKPVTTTKSFLSMKATAQSHPVPLRENITSNQNVVSQSSDIGDIDRRLNALQAFLQEAKSQR